MVNRAVGALALVDGPDAVMMWSPAVLEGTRKLAVQCPRASAVIAVATVVVPNLMEMPLSLARYAFPVTLMVEPGAAVGWSIISVGVTSNLAWALPEDTRIVLDPPAKVVGISTAPRRKPSESAWSDWRGEPSIVRSTLPLGVYPEPVTWIDVPGGPLIGDTWKLEATEKDLVGRFPMLTW